MDRNTLKNLYRCVAVACLGASSIANAVEPRFYQLGDGGAVAPHVKLEFGNDNNPLRSNEGSQEAMYLRLQPSLRYLVQQRNNRLELGYQGNYYQYFQDYCQAQDGLVRPGDCNRGSPTFDKATYQDHRLGLSGFLEVSSRLRATVTGSQVIEHQPIGTGQSASRGVLNNLTSPDAWNRQTLRGEIAYGAAKARGEVRAGLTLSNRDFDTDNSGVNLNNLNESSIAPDVTLLYRIGTRTQLFAGLGAQDVSSKGNSARDVSRLRFGAELDSSAITSGRIEFSSVTEKFRRTESGEKRKDLEYLGWKVELTWKPRRYSTVTIGGGRESESGLFNDSLGLTTNIDGEWVHQWRERFTTIVGVGYEFNEDLSEFSENRGSEDLPLSFRVEANYNIRRWLDIGGFLGIDSRTGEKLTRARDANDQLTDEIATTEDLEFGRTTIGITLNGTI